MRHSPDELTEEWHQPDAEPVVDRHETQGTDCKHRSGRQRLSHQSLIPDRATLSGLNQVLTDRCIHDALENPDPYPV